MATGEMAFDIGSQKQIRLGTIDIILYGLGEVANSIRLVLFGLLLLFFYTSVMGLSGTLVGIASATGLIVNAVLAPYIGYLSDRWQWWLGRRHSPMVVGSVVVGLGFWASFSPPRGLATAELFGWLMATGLIVHIASTVFTIPYYALGAELSSDYHKRTSITAIRGACGLAGLLAAGGLPFLLFFPRAANGLDPKLNYDGYPITGLVFGLMMVATALVATVSTLRWRPYLAEARDEPRTESHRGFLRGLVIALGNGSFRLLFVSFGIVFLGTVANSILLIHFITYYVGLAGSQIVSSLQLTFYGAALVGVVVWLRLSRSMDKRWMYLVATVILAALLVSGFILVGPGRPLGVGQALPIILGEAFAGVIASLYWILPTSMVADIADEDELETDERREGMYFGIFTLGQQLAAGVAVLLTGVLIDRFAGLVAGQAQQAPVTIDRIGLLFTVFPAILLVVGAVVLLPYSLDRTRIGAIQQELARRGQVKFGVVRPLDP